MSNHKLTIEQITSLPELKANGTHYDLAIFFHFQAKHIPVAVGFATASGTVEEYCFPTSRRSNYAMPLLQYDTFLQVLNKYIGRYNGTALVYGTDVLACLEIIYGKKELSPYTQPLHLYDVQPLLSNGVSADGIVSSIGLSTTARLVGLMPGDIPKNHPGINAATILQLINNEITVYDVDLYEKYRESLTRIRRGVPVNQVRVEFANYRLANNNTEEDFSESPKTKLASIFNHLLEAARLPCTKTKCEPNKNLRYKVIESHSDLQKIMDGKVISIDFEFSNGEHPIAVGFGYDGYWKGYQFENRKPTKKTKKCPTISVQDFYAQLDLLVQYGYTDFIAFGPNDIQCMSVLANKHPCDELLQKITFYNIQPVLAKVRKTGNHFVFASLSETASTLEIDTKSYTLHNPKDDAMLLLHVAKKIASLSDKEYIAFVGRLEGERNEANDPDVSSNAALTNQILTIKEEIGRIRHLIELRKEEIEAEVVPLSRAEIIRENTVKRSILSRRAKIQTLQPINMKYDDLILPTFVEEVTFLLPNHPNPVVPCCISLKHNNKTKIFVLDDSVSKKKIKAQFGLVDDPLKFDNLVARMINCKKSGTKILFIIHRSQFTLEIRQYFLQKILSVIEPMDFEIVLIKN